VPDAGEPATRAGGRRRLSFNEQREFDGLPARIEELELRKTELEALVAGTTFYSRSHGEVRETLSRLQALGEQIEAAYERWQQLESRR
jgi:ATP-binding cassette subfamily F protein uup